MSVKKTETAGGEKDTFDVVPPSVDRIKAIAQKRFESSRGSHDWDHTLRVYSLCERIGKAEDVDMEVLLISALLHDIGRDNQDSSNGKMCHAKKGAEIARPIIKALRLDKKQKQNILHAIRSHRFRSTCLPKTQEARVLFDADKLDAIGAVGVARAYLFAGEVGARLHNPDIDVETAEPYSREDTGFREFKVKLSKIKDRILTEEGKKLAEKRHAFMDVFFKHFKEEYEGVR